MAVVKSLSIRGIRSFGPEDSDKQGIAFESPLTLILGQNGCGKTTVIEALRYAITSQLPPGIGNNDSCFIHDSKINRTHEVWGQIKLKLLSAKSKNIEVTRTMKAEITRKNFTTVDNESQILITDDEGKQQNISSAILCDELGVSKAILNFVLFCHQEESSWPLDESKKVKDRFDAIFDSDKYSKCFDKLKKIRNNYSNGIKVLDAEVHSLERQKKELDVKRLDVLNTETRISEVGGELVEVTNKLKATEEKLQAINELESALALSNSKLETLKVKLEQCRKHEEEMKKAIKNVFEGTLDELKENISNYKHGVEAKCKELTECSSTIAKLKEQKKIVANKVQNAKLEREKLAMLSSEHVKKIVRRNKEIINVANLAGIEDITTIESKDEAEQAMPAILDAIKSMEKELKEMKATANTEENEQQKLISDSLKALVRREQQISSKEAAIANTKESVTQIKKDIAANQSKARLEAAEKKFKAAEDNYKAVEVELNIEEHEQQIDEREKELEKDEQELDIIDDKVKKLEKQGAILKELEVIEESVNQKDKQLSVLLNKHRPVLTELLGTMPEEKYAITVNKLEISINREVDDIKKKLNNRKTELTKLEAERKHVRNRLAEYTCDYTRAEELLYEACGTQTYEATLEKLNATVEKLQDDRNVLSSSILVIKKYESQLEESKCCPLCSRAFDNDSEVFDLISQLGTKVENVPTQLEKVSEELQRASAKKDALLSMKSLNEKIQAYKEKHKPELENKLTEIEEKIKTVSETIEQLTVSMVEPEKKLQTLKQIQGEMPLMDICKQELENIIKDFEKIKAQCSDIDTDMTLDEANEKQKLLKQKITSMKAKVKDIRRLQDLASKKNKLHAECLNLQIKVQEIYNLQDKQKQMESDREKYVAELEELKKSIAPLQDALQETKNAKAEVVKKHRDIMDTKNKEITSLAVSYEKVKSLDKEINQFDKTNLTLAISNNTENLKKLKEKLQQIDIDIEAAMQRNKTLEDEINKEEIYKRELDDNMRLRDMQKDIEGWEKDEAEINETLRTIKKEDLAEKAPLTLQHKKLTEENYTTNGKLEELQCSLTGYKYVLDKALSKNIEKRYRAKYYERQVTKMLEKDVGDYSIALEKSLLEFHNKKMESINLIIRELWSKIYSGNDIDYIAIKAEGSMTQDSGRRKYDYRVVQCKNGVEIDMRGRCSAGQKVLACLIIRLALAETFSSRFGVLALDEPTTNLDQENVNSLCMALGEIVKERMVQKNFMFIIITHDREFIESLGQIDKVTHFHELARNEDGKSRVKRVRFT